MNVSLQYFLTLYGPLICLLCSQSAPLPTESGNGAWLWLHRYTKKVIAESGEII